MKYYIGIDGGGTKTAAIIQSEDGREAIITLPGSNNSYIGVEASLQIVKDAVMQLTNKLGAKISDVSGVFVGIAGATANNYIAVCSDMLTELLPNAAVKVDVDVMNLLAMLDGDGAALICGTGSICYANKGDTRTRIGGYADFDGAGSGTFIGKDALMLSLKIYDGRKSDSLLNRMVIEKLGGQVHPNLSMLMKAERAYIASFAPLVFRAAKSGDTHAKEILSRNFEYLGEMVDRAAEILGTDTFTLVTGGGIMRDPMSDSMLLSYTKANPIIIYCDDQSRGALSMAKKLVGKN